MAVQYVHLLLKAINVFQPKNNLTGLLTIVLFWGIVGSFQFAVYNSQLLPSGIGMKYDVALHNKTYVKCLAPFGCNVNNVQLLDGEQLQIFSLNASIHIVGYYAHNATGLHEVASLLSGNALSLPTSPVGLESNITLYRVEMDGDMWRYTSVDRALDIACDDCVSFWLTFSPLANVVYSTKDLNIGIIFEETAKQAFVVFLACWGIAFFDKMHRSTEQASLGAYASHAAHGDIHVEVEDF